MITETQRKLGGTKAKPLKEQLPEDIIYEEIRCVLAEMSIKSPTLEGEKIERTITD